MSALTPAEVATAALHLQAAKYFQGAGFMMLVYDHAITFGEEVDRVWKREITGASILFFLNRYLTPIQFAIELDAFNRGWPTKFCDRAVAFEGYATLCLVAVCEIIMILRVFALYSRNYKILGILLVALAIQVAVAGFGMSDGMSVPLPPGFVGCIFTGSLHAAWFPALWYAPVVTDFIIFCLTLYRALKYSKVLGSSTPLLRQLMRDGVLYFAVIFSANMINVIIYRVATEDLKAIGASFSQMITSIMISRLVLNLRGVGETPTHLTNERQPQQPVDFMTRTIGNLGEEFRPAEEEDTPPDSPNHPFRDSWNSPSKDDYDIHRLQPLSP